MESKFKDKIQTLYKQIHYTSGIVDVYKLAESLGIRVIEEDLPDKVSGVLDCRHQNNPIVLLNSGHFHKRKRFTLAHEIGHFVLHKITGVHMDSKIFLRQEAPTSQDIKIEREANQFAAELLMPEDEIRRAWEELPEDWFDKKPLDTISGKLGVSEAALLIRLKQLKGFIPNW